jgi:hypothetical protein
VGISQPIPHTKKQKRNKGKKNFLTDGNALSTGEYPFETGEKVKRIIIK